MFDWEERNVLVPFSDGLEELGSLRGTLWQSLNSFALLLSASLLTLHDSLVLLSVF